MIKLKYILSVLCGALFVGQSYACDFEFVEVRNSSFNNTNYTGIVKMEDGAEFGVQLVPLNKDSHLKLKESVQAKKGVCLEGTRNHMYYVYSVEIKD